MKPNLVVANFAIIACVGFFAGYETALRVHVPARAAPIEWTRYYEPLAPISFELPGHADRIPLPRSALCLLVSRDAATSCLYMVVTESNMGPRPTWTADDARELVRTFAGAGEHAHVEERTLDGATAFELTGCEVGRTVRCRAVLASGHLFALTTNAPEGAPTERFFSSLRIGER